MDRLEEIFKSVGRMEAQLQIVLELCPRVTALERWQALMQGVWSALVAAYAFIWNGSYGK